MEPVEILSAFALLNDVERDFVEVYVRMVKNEAARINERVSHAMLRPIPADVVLRSRGLLQKPLILAAINQRLQEIADEEDITPERIIREMYDIATSNLADFIEIQEGQMSLMKMQTVSRRKMATVKKVEFKPGMYGVQTSIQLHDKQAALTQLGQMMGIVDPENQHWKRMKDVPADLKQLPAAATPQQAEKAYSDLLENIRMDGPQ